MDSCEWMERESEYKMARRRGGKETSSFDLRLKSALFGSDEEAHFDISTRLPLDSIYIPLSSSSWLFACQANSYWSENLAPTAHQTPLTLLRRLFLLRGLTNAFLSHQIKKKNGDNNSTVPQSLQEDVRLRYEARSSVPNPASVLYWPEQWTVARLFANTSQLSSSLQSYSSQIEAAILREEKERAFRKIRFVEATQPSPSGHLFMHYLLSLFEMNRQFLCGLGTTNDFKHAAFHVDFVLAVKLYHLPIPSALFRHIGSSSSNDEDPFLFLLHKGYSILATCIFRLYHFHRLMAWAKANNDGPCVYFCQLLIDSHLPLWSSMEQTGQWKDGDLLQMKPRILSVDLEPKHPLSPEHYTQRTRHMGAFADYPQTRTTTTTTPNNGQSLPPPPPLPSWKTTRQHPTVWASLYQTYYPSTLSCGDCLEEAPSLHRIIVDGINTLFPKTTSNSPLSTGSTSSTAADSVAAAASSSATASITNYVYGNLNADLIRMLFLRLLPGKWHAKYDQTRMRKVLRRHPTMSSLLLALVRVGCLGNFPDYNTPVTNRPTFQMRVRLSIIFQALTNRFVGKPHARPHPAEDVFYSERLIDFLIDNRRVVDTMLKQALLTHLSMIHGAEQALALHFPYLLWKTGTLVCANLWRNRIDFMPLRDGGGGGNDNNATEMFLEELDLLMKTCTTQVSSDCEVSIKNTPFATTFLQWMTETIFPVVRGKFKTTIGKKQNNNNNTNNNKKTEEEAEEGVEEDVVITATDEDGRGSDNDSDLDDYARELSDALLQHQEEEEGGESGSGDRSDNSDSDDDDDGDGGGGGNAEDDLKREMRAGMKYLHEENMIGKRMAEVRSVNETVLTMALVASYVPYEYNDEMMRMLVWKITRSTTTPTSKCIDLSFMSIISSLTELLELQGVSTEAISLFQHWIIFYNKYALPKERFLTDIVNLWLKRPTCFAVIWRLLYYHSVYSCEIQVPLPRQALESQIIARKHILQSDPRIPIDSAEAYQRILYFCSVCKMWAHPTSPSAHLCVFKDGPTKFLDPMQIAYLATNPGSSGGSSNTLTAKRTGKGGSSSSTTAAPVTFVGFYGAPPATSIYNGHKADISFAALNNRGGATNSPLGQAGVRTEIAKPHAPFVVNTQFDPFAQARRCMRNQSKMPSLVLLRTPITLKRGLSDDDNNNNGLNTRNGEGNDSFLDPDWKKGQFYTERHSLACAAFHLEMAPHVLHSRHRVYKLIKKVDVPLHVMPSKPDPVDSSFQTLYHTVLQQRKAHDMTSEERSNCVAEYVTALVDARMESLPNSAKRGRRCGEELVPCNMMGKQVWISGRTFLLCGLCSCLIIAEQSRFDCHHGFVCIKHGLTMHGSDPQNGSFVSSPMVTTPTAPDMATVLLPGHVRLSDILWLPTSLSTQAVPIIFWSKRSVVNFEEYAERFYRPSVFQQQTSSSHWSRKQLRLRFATNPIRTTLIQLDDGGYSSHVGEDGPILALEQRSATIHNPSMAISSIPSILLGTALGLPTRPPLELQCMLCKDKHRMFATTILVAGGTLRCCPTHAKPYINAIRCERCGIRMNAPQVAPWQSVVIGTTSPGDNNNTELNALCSKCRV